MKNELIVLISVWILSFILLFIVPSDRKRIAHIGLLCKQAMTWLLGLVVVELGWMEYPYRLFADVNRSSFTFEFLAYPVICGVFNAYYPENRGKGFLLFYYIAFTSAITLVEAIIEIYTLNIRYIHWEWYWTWITIFVTFMMSRMFCKWFFCVRNFGVSYTLRRPY